MRLNDVLSEGILEPPEPTDGGAMLSVTVRRSAGVRPVPFCANAPAASRALAPVPQVVGASGDLAKKKIFPALFALYYEGTLPKVRRSAKPQPACPFCACATRASRHHPPPPPPRQNFTIMGFARSKMTLQEFRDMITLTLTCRIDQRCVAARHARPRVPRLTRDLLLRCRETCGPKQEEFISRCFYCAGQYDETASFEKLSAELATHEVGRVANRIFYLSIPPTIFVSVAQNAARAASSKTGALLQTQSAPWHGALTALSPAGYTRVIVEKPFGRDLESSRELGRGLAEALTEEQIYRCAPESTRSRVKLCTEASLCVCSIDHYLGKELIENLTVLRFSNLVFQPLWNRQFIRNVQIIFSENFGTEGRGGAWFSAPLRCVAWL